SILATVLFWTLSDAQMSSWGWRIPFFLSIPIGLFGLYLRRHLEETPIFENDISENQEQQPSLLETIKTYKKDIFLCIVFVAFFNMTNYLLLGYMPSYLDENIGISDTISTPVTAIVLIIMVPFAITFGKLGDKLGNKKVITIGLVLAIVFSIFSFQFLNIGSIPFLFIGLLMLGIVLSAYEGTMPGSLPTLFHTNIRYRTLSWTFNISVSIFGGTTPLVAAWLVHVTGSNLAPGFYLLAFSLIGLIVVLTLFKDTSGKSLKGSYPTVASKAEYKEAVENPKDSLWWKIEPTDK
ncbi:MFS transporter, partial [Priestia filamentosa]